MSSRRNGMATRSSCGIYTPSWSVAKFARLLSDSNRIFIVSDTPVGRSGQPSAAGSGRVSLHAMSCGRQ